MLKMGCVNCGAGLEIGPQLDVFACSYCGSLQRVERKGGTVALQKVESAIRDVQRGTDRTAAELALPRLKSELADIQARRKAELSRCARRVESERTARRVLAWVLGGGIFLVSQMLAMKFDSGLAFVAGLATAIGLPIYLLTKLPKTADESVRINGEFDASASKVERHLEATRAVLDALPSTVRTHRPTR